MSAAILIIDMLNEFVYGNMKCDDALAIIPNIKRLVEQFRSCGLPVVYLCDTHYQGVDKELDLWGRHAIAGSWGAKVISELEPKEGDFVIRKRRYSGFFQTDLDLLLRELHVDQVILTGIDTNICVRHTAADAFFMGYRIIVVNDAVASWDGREESEKGIKYMSTIYGAGSITTDNAIRSYAPKSGANS